MEADCSEENSELGKVQAAKETFCIALLLEHYSPLWSLAPNTILTHLYRLLNNFFPGIWMSTQCPTPNLEDQGVS
jgi:hypothetical protein